MNIKNLKATVFLNLYGLFKIPLVFFCTPRVIESTAQKFVVKIPLNYRTRNHVHSMYFAALAVGSELSVAAPAVLEITEGMHKIDFIFKDFQAQFLKRGDGDVHFICEEVHEVVSLIKQATTNPQRLEKKIKGYAVVPAISATEPIMTYELTLSVKNRSKK